MIRDVEITITRDTQIVSSMGFGLPLIAGTAGVKNYAEVTNLEEVVTAGHAVTSVVYKMAAAVFAQTPKVGKIAVVGFADKEGLIDGLDELIQMENEWYFLLCPERDEVEVKALSIWANKAGKLYVTVPDGDIPAITALAGHKDMKLDRTIVLYHDDESGSNFPDAAWVGKCASMHPGAITWKFKTLVGIAPVGLTSAEIASLHDANVNTYIRKMGVDQTSEGLTASGEFIDVIRGTDWIAQRVSERVQSLLSASLKIPYDNRGIALVLAQIQAVMQEGVAQEVIAVDSDGNGLWDVTAPNREDIMPDKIANRILPDVEFNLTLAGAIHTVQVYGVVQI